MFGRANIRLGIDPHSSFPIYSKVLKCRTYSLPQILCYEQLPVLYFAFGARNLELIAQHWDCSGFDPVPIHNVAKVTETSMRLLQTTEGLILIPYMVPRAVGCNCRIIRYRIDIAAQHFPRKWMDVSCMGSCLMTNAVLFRKQTGNVEIAIWQRLLVADSCCGCPEDRFLYFLGGLCLVGGKELSWIETT